MAKDSKGIAQQPPAEAIQHPLVRLLIRSAEVRGDTLVTLVKELGVSYERFTQWRRSEADIGNARRSVHHAAARYAGVPPVLILALCRKFELDDFIVPSAKPIKDRLKSEITRIMEHKMFGGFVPRELAEAKDSIKVLVIFLVHQIEARSESQTHWLSVMHLIANARYENKTADRMLREQVDSDELFL